MRRLLASFAFALASLACASANADEQPDYAPPVLACVAAAGADRAALNACRGLTRQHCADESDDVTTHGMVMCESAEAEAWGAIMDATLLRLFSERSEIGNALKSAQSAWARYADAECGYRAARWGLGSGAQVAVASCYAELTASRAITLIAIAREID